jgi:hypothetical protein
MAKELHCLHCNKIGSPNEFRPWGLYCSEACRKGYEAKAQSAVAQLKALGFTQHPETPNLFVKDGVHISKEQVHRGNLPELVQKHAAVAARR